MAKGTCSIEDCEDPIDSRVWCSRHYSRWLRYGDPLAGGRFRAKRGKRSTCFIDDCASPVSGLGLCVLHRARLRKHGDPLAHIPRRHRAPDGSSYVMSNGYRVIKINGHWMLEHRHIAERELGRSLLPEESIHHRNGQRTDNRPGNLELWIKPQPTGQRVADLLAFVVEHYPEQLRAMLG